MTHDYMIALMLSSQQGNIDVVQILLNKQNININAQNNVIVYVCIFIGLHICHILKNT